MRYLLTVITLTALSFTFGSINTNGVAEAQQGPSLQSGDALWHLPKFGESGWFLHAHNGKVRACNMDGASVAGDRQAPKCSNWE